MEKIIVFDTSEQAEPTLNRYLADNEKIRERMQAIGKEKEKKYRKESGFEEKIRELLKNPVSSHHHPIEPLHPSEYGLPLKERKKLWADVGKGLEMVCAINLSSYNGTYNFNYEITKNIGAVGPEDFNYATLGNMVACIRECLAEESVIYHGAAIKPIFYTTNEEVRMKEEDVEVIRKNLEEKAIDDADFPSELKSQMLKGLKDIVDCANIPTRGLNEEERAEFERLY